jgi:hypothetical protein
MIVKLKRLPSLMVIGSILILYGNTYSEGRREEMKTLIFGKEISGETVHDDNAKKFVVPAGLKFEILGEPKVSKDKIMMEGVLINRQAKSYKIYVFPESGYHPFSFTFIPNENVKRKTVSPPLPQQVPPPPMKIMVPAMSQILFKYSLDLSYYDYSDSPLVVIEWSFYYWNEPRPHGEFKITLPKR